MLQNLTVVFCGEMGADEGLANYPTASKAFIRLPFLDLRHHAAFETIWTRRSLPSLRFFFCFFFFSCQVQLARLELDGKEGIGGI